MVVITLSHIDPMQSNVYFFRLLFLFWIFNLSGSKCVSLVLINITISRDCNRTLNWLFAMICK